VQRLVDVADQVHDKPHGLALREPRGVGRRLEDLNRLIQRVDDVVWSDEGAEGIARRNRIGRITRGAERQIDEVPFPVAGMVPIEVIGFLNIIGRPSCCDGPVRRAGSDVVGPGGDGGKGPRREIIAVLEDSTEGRARCGREPILGYVSDGLMAGTAERVGVGRGEREEDDQEGSPFHGVLA